MMPREPDYIAQLVETIQNALETGDYSVRLVKNGEQAGMELLVDAFNAVITRLQEQKKDIDLRRSFVKEEVALRTEEMERTQRDLTLAKREAELGSQSKSVFLANMSHELRTPLNAIIGYSEMLLEEAQDLGQKRLVPDLQKIALAGKHLLEWVDEILDLSKIESGRSELKLQPFDIASLIRDVEAAILPIIQEAGNTLEVRCEPGIGSMNADRKRIHRVLFTLLKNASKTTQKSPITFAARRESVDRIDWIRFDVMDSGPGIPPDLLRNLFKDYTHADAATSSAYGGVALSIAICQRFSLLMGGHVSAESELGKGTTFTLRLPAEMENHLAKSHVVRGTNRLIRDLLNIGDFHP